MLTLSEWSLTHQEEFIKLADGFSGEERRTFQERLCFAVVDSGRGESFRASFARHQSPAVKEILRLIP
jgi:hypothetical protein